MKAIVYYLTLPLIYLVASLPFSWLYKVSDFFYFFLIKSGYRKNVVIKNLSKSFPEKTTEEIDQLYKEYYQYLCDLILETIKTLTITEKEVLERCTYTQPKWMEEYYLQGRSIIIVMGHFGNWELGGPVFSLHNNHQLNVIYRPLTNPYFEALMCKMRTGFGTKITKVNDTLRVMVSDKKNITAIAFIADQTASPANAYWTEFLNQDTAVFVGYEKLAKKFNYPVVYMPIKRLKRGYYTMEPELMFDNPSETKEFEICEAFTRRLEKDIIKNPTTWLWSHKRWKHKRV